MRSSLRMAVLFGVMLVLLVPLAAAADGPCGYCGNAAPPPAAPCPAGNPCYGTSTTGPCPDDPEKSAECIPDTPPYYVVINRQVTCPGRDGSGCTPIILKHPECTDCRSRECAAIDIQAEVCKPMLAGRVPAGQTEVVYEMCCAGADGDGWLFRIRRLDAEGNCPIDPDNQGWIEGLPPGTGIDLPTPLVVGGLTAFGAGFLAVGVVLRRKTR